MEQILAALEQLDIRDYRIEETKEETLEWFFVKKNLDLKRRTDTVDRMVTVYHPFEQDGKKMLGSSQVNIHPGMEEEELLNTLKKADHAASLICNPYYELFRGKREEWISSESGFAKGSLEEGLKLAAETLFAPDTQEEVFLNSAELFLKRQNRRIVNSRGVDVSYERYELWGEYVVQCVTPEDVETYHSFSYGDPDMEGLRRDVEEAISMTRARARAKSAPRAGEYSLILSGKSMEELFSYYVERANMAMVYQQYSSYRPGMAVQGEEVQGEGITISLKAKEPYSPEGIPMKDRLLMENGVLKNLHGGARFAFYLGMEPTGVYRKIALSPGRTPLADLKAGSCLHVVSFSDFQMDPLSGHFGGEIRLAFLYDGEKEIPVTGGSVNGSILDAQKRLAFSSETYESANYEGPFAVKIEGVKVAGQE